MNRSSRPWWEIALAAYLLRGLSRPDDYRRYLWPRFGLAAGVGMVAAPTRSRARPTSVIRVPG